MAQLNFDFDTATNYNERHAHHRDSRIVFEPGEHKYIVDGEVVCDSVTQVVTSFFAQFDADYWAARKATPDCPAEKLKAMWAAKGEEARDLGTLLHHRIEEYYLGHESDCDAANERGYMHFMAFAADHSLTPYRSEWPIFSRRYRIAGTLDQGVRCLQSATAYKLWQICLRANKSRARYHISPLCAAAQFLPLYACD